jgi:hypothetical protein
MSSSSPSMSLPQHNPVELPWYVTRMPAPWPASQRGPRRLPECARGDTSPDLGDAGTDGAVGGRDGYRTVTRQRHN